MATAAPQKVAFQTVDELVERFPRFFEPFESRNVSLRQYVIDGSFRRNSQL